MDGGRGQDVLNAPGVTVDEGPRASLDRVPLQQPWLLAMIPAHCAMQGCSRDAPAGAEPTHCLPASSTETEH